MRKGFWPKVLPVLLLFFLIAPSAAIRPAAAVEMLHNVVLDLTKGRDPYKGPYRFRCPVFGTCNHRIVGIFFVKRRGIFEAWVVAAVPNESDCHACASRMTLEIHRRQGGRWRKHQAWRDFTEWGDWGVVRPREVRLGKIDDKRMILFLQGAGTHMGLTVDVAEIFIIDNEDITPVRRFCLAFDNEGALTPELSMKHVKWSARYRLTTVNGRPALVFRLRDDVKNEQRTVTYEIMGKGLRLRSPGDDRLENGC